MRDFIDTINDWLISRALRERDLSETIQQLAGRLIEGGIPVARIVVGRGMAHPVVGLATLDWERESNAVTLHVASPDQVTDEYVRSTPFGWMALQGETVLQADLRDPEQRKKFALYQKLSDEGMTGYLAHQRNFDSEDVLPRQPTEMKGLVVSFTTRRFTGFSEADAAAIERIVTPLAVCVRVAIDKLLVNELLERYLGRISGRHVLTGQTQRGDGQTINCALFYSDMRDSVGLSRKLDAATYLEAVNQYFDCTAQAVLENGGEVLKFIGDGILAIFPFDDELRQPSNMCGAALSAAREAFARVEHANALRKQADLPPIAFGIGLHVGEVIYGNVGTARRLDFTATGPAVGLVSRCESMTRGLDTPIVATAEFAEHCPQQADSIGTHDVRSFDESRSLYSYSTGL